MKLSIFGSIVLIFLLFFAYSDDKIVFDELTFKKFDIANKQIYVTPYIETIKVDQKGNFYLLCNLSKKQSYLSKYNKEGYIDLSFGNNGKIFINEILQSLGIKNIKTLKILDVIISNQKIYLHVSLKLTKERKNIVFCLLDNGKIDNSFGKLGKIELPKNSQSIYITEKFIIISHQHNDKKITITKMNINGKIDKNFGIKGKLDIYKQPSDIHFVILDNSNMYVLFTSIDYIKVYSYNLLGKINQGFGKNGVLFFPIKYKLYHHLYSQRDKKIYIILMDIIKKEGELLEINHSGLIKSYKFKMNQEIGKYDIIYYTKINKDILLLINKLDKNIIIQHIDINNGKTIKKQFVNYYLQFQYSIFSFDNNLGIFLSIREDENKINLLKIDYNGIIDQKFGNNGLLTIQEEKILGKFVETEKLKIKDFVYYKGKLCIILNSLINENKLVILPDISPNLNNNQIDFYLLNSRDYMVRSIEFLDKTINKENIYLFGSVIYKERNHQQEKSDSFILKIDNKGNISKIFLLQSLIKRNKSFDFNYKEKTGLKLIRADQKFLHVLLSIGYDHYILEIDINLQKITHVKNLNQYINNGKDHIEFVDKLIDSNDIYIFGKYTKNSGFILNLDKSLTKKQILYLENIDRNIKSVNYMLVNNGDVYIFGPLKYSGSFIFKTDKLLTKKQILFLRNFKIKGKPLIKNKSIYLVLTDQKYSYYIAKIDENLNIDKGFAKNGFISIKPWLPHFYSEYLEFIIPSNSEKIYFVTYRYSPLLSFITNKVFQTNYIYSYHLGKLKKYKVKDIYQIYSMYYEGKEVFLLGQEFVSEYGIPLILQLDSK